MLTVVEWANTDTVTVPLNKTSEQDVKYTRGASSEISVLDDNFIIDAKLAIHGSTGAQLANLPNKNNINIKGVTWSCKDNVVTAIGETGEVASNTSTTIAYSIPIIPGNYHISRIGGVVDATIVILSATGTSTFYNNNAKFTLTGNERSAVLFLQVKANTTVNNTIKIMLNSGNTGLPFEPYTGGTPYTDKYTANIKNQTENTVTLSVKNARASASDSIVLDAVLTDKNGITQRSEVGKTFNGGE